MENGENTEKKREREVKLKEYKKWNAGRNGE